MTRKEITILEICREKLGYTQEQLALECGIPTRIIQVIESGKLDISHHTVGENHIDDHEKEALTTTINRIANANYTFGILSSSRLVEHSKKCLCCGGKNVERDIVTRNGRDDREAISRLNGVKKSVEANTLFKKRVKNKSNENGKMNGALSKEEIEKIKKYNYGGSNALKSFETLAAEFKVSRTTLRKYMPKEGLRKREKYRQENAHLIVGRFGMPWLPIVKKY